MEIEHSKENEEMMTFFQHATSFGHEITMGKILLKPGEMRPLEGFACHEEDEYSYVISGDAHTILEDGTDLVGKPGDAQLIRAGEKHRNYNSGTEDAVVVWFLVGR